MRLISWLGTATKLSSLTSGQVFSTRKTELSSGNSFYANRREGTSALHTVYALFYKQRSGISNVKEHSRALHTVYASFCKQIPGVSHVKEHSSALHTVYASFYKQRSDISHEKEQTRYKLCMPRSLSKDSPSAMPPRNKRSTHCIFIVL